MADHSLHEIDGLKLGDHLCWIYRNDLEFRSFLVPFLHDGLKRNERVLCILDGQTAPKILKYLEDDGLETSTALPRCRLQILTTTETYLREGVFDPERMLALLRSEEDRSLQCGFSGLRVTGDMSWTLRGVPGAERLIEYEAKLNEFFPTSKCLGLCQYDQRHFKAEILLDVLAAHPIVAIGTELFQNPHYIPSGELLGNNREEARLRCQIGNLIRQKRAEEALKENEERYRGIFDGSLDAIFLTTPGGVLAEVNEAACALTGYSREELTGMNLFKLYEPKAFGMKPTHFTSIQAGEILTTAATTMRKDGRGVTSELTSKGVMIKGRAYVLTVVRDMTESRKAEERIRMLSRQLLQAQESERRRISRELHDSIAQDFCSLKINLDTLLLDSPGLTSQEQKKVAEMSRAIHRSIGCVRDLAYDLHPPEVENEDLAETIRLYCEDFSQRTAMSLDFITDGLEGVRLDFDTRLALYRLVQESLLNINKHANATHVLISLCASFPYLLLQIEDNGKGFDVRERFEAAVKERRMGLHIMQERAAMLRGEMHIESHPPLGTSILVRIPYEEGEHASKKDYLDRG